MTAGVVIVILLILQAAFGAWRLALFVLLAMPAAAAGGVVATLATGHLSRSGALAGFLLVIAITIRHSIALIDRFRRLEEAGSAGVELALAGVQERLVPIVTTVLATAVFAPPVHRPGRCRRARDHAADGDLRRSAAWSAPPS